jgi:hypothetical protein
MGQQQLLMVVLSMVLIGVAIVVGATMMQVNAMENMRAVLIHDLLTYAGKARGYYWRPPYLGGAGRDFNVVAGMNLFFTAGNANENGRYYIESAEKDEMVMGGVGALVIGGDSVRVRLRINERSSQIEYLN